MDILRIVGVALVSTLLCIFLRKLYPEIALQVSIACCVCIFIFCFQYFKDMIGFLQTLGSMLQNGYDNILYIIKITGICYICGFIVELIRDARENAVASKVEMAVKMMLLCSSFPMILSFIELVTGILP